MLTLARLLDRAATTSLYNDWDFSGVRDFGDSAWAHLPTLSRQQLQQHGFLIKGEGTTGEILFFSSGTTGTPKMIPYDQADLDRVSDACARFAAFEGIGPHERIMVLLPLGLWTVGRITVDGHIKNGAKVYPVDLHGGVPAWQSMAERIRPTIISSTPSVLSAWAPHYKGPRLNLVETTGEPLLLRERHYIEAKFGGFVQDSYGLSECVVGVECRMREGFHFWPDAVGVEILDLETPSPLPAGESGEIALTSFMQEKLPILRYRSGDRGRLLSGTCPCGHSTPRLLLEGRICESWQMPRGVLVHPEDVELALQESGGKGRVIWKGAPGSPATPYVGDYFRPTLEIVLSEMGESSSEEIRREFLAALPEIAELVHENEIELGIYGNE